MKGLIYPLLGIATLTLLVFINAAIIVGINNAWKQRAIRRARWEPYVDITGDGKADIGVRLVARWGHHTKTLRRDNDTEQIDAEDIIARIDAYTRAETRADSYNALMPNGEHE